MNFYRLRFLMFALAAVMVLSGIGLSQELPDAKTVKVIGSSTIRNKNIAKAREEAVSNSLVSAVNLVALETLPLDALVRNFEKLDEILYDHTAKFVEGYKVLAEFRSGKIYRVMLEATVSDIRLKELEKQLSAGELAKAKGEKKAMPRILFLIAEQNLADSTPQYWWGGTSAFDSAVSENAMSEKMKEKGFTIVRHGYLSPDSEIKSPVNYQPELDNQEAVRMGSRLQADIIVVGKSVVYKVSGAARENVLSFSGTVSVRVLRTDTGEEIASSLQTAVNQNTDETAGSRDALLSAGYLAGKELSFQIAGIWQKGSLSFSDRQGKREAAFSRTGSSRKSDMLEIIVSGISNLGNFVRFRRALSDIPGVKKIDIRERRRDEATIGIKFQGKAGEFEDALMQKTFQLFSVKLYDTSQNTLKIELIPK